MPDQVVILPDDSANTGKKVDNSELTVGANTVERQRIVVADPTSATGLLQIAGGAAKVDGSAVTQPISGSVSVSNLPATQVVSGTVTANAGTGNFPSTVADGADVNAGTTSDAAITSDNNGTLSGKLRGLVKILADVWDSVNHRIKVDGSGVTQPVSGTFWQATQPVSGTVGVNNFPADQLVHEANLDVAASTLAKASTQTDGTQKTQVTNFPAIQPISGTVVADDSATLQTLIDVQRASLQELQTLTTMFTLVFSPNANLGGLMNTAPGAVTN